MNYLSRFDYEIQYIKGEENKVADCLSCYYENNTLADVCPPEDYANGDVHLDPLGDDLPVDRLLKVGAQLRASRPMDTTEASRQSVRLCEKAQVKERCLEASEMNTNPEPDTRESPPTGADEDPSVFNSSGMDEVLPQFVNATESLRASIQTQYLEDPLLSKIIQDPKAHPAFSKEDDYVYLKNGKGRDVLCMPRGLHDGKSITGILIEQAHNALGHFGTLHTADYIRRWYWWQKLGQEVEKYC
ncbi:hypothetical protein HYDPIDRAFT_33617 [Hydnomerulius pinastri MD-312]|uniref:Integrase zinc-binding domain-containing protein n=1 Tax=Hydnomerulius pinastri MD-312 TaxID=994086 RepID=A0A0C9VZS3_9AGAM|nr:hypothetical protein HYDPIDRAFT_33617 [Hydnomerulius pinastri MD-312]